MTRAVPQAAFDLVRQVEGLRLTAYQDVAGVWTDGYGNTHNVVPGGQINQAQADSDLLANLQIAAERLAGVVDDAVIQVLTDNQYSALISFVFNLGANPAWTIWKVLNQRQFDQVPAQLIRFCYAGNPPVKVQGLVNRRTAEINLFSLDEPGSIDTSPSSSVTRATATPAVPTDPNPRGIRTIAATAGTVGLAAVGQAGGAVQAVKDAITPYADSADIIRHVLSLLGVIGAGLAIGALVFKYLQDRKAKSWSKSAAPALHPTILENAMNPNPPPGGTVVGQALPPQTQPATVVIQSGAGTAKPTMSLLAEVRDKLGAYFAKVTGEVRQFTGQTITDIAAEIDKLRADLESKL